MKIIFLSIAVILSMAVTSQVNKVSFKASGLTCSMCSNSIYKALKTLDFIDDINANVKTYTFELSFKSNSIIDFDMIKKKVEGAGFAISSFVASIVFDNVLIKKEQAISIGDKSFLFLNAEEQVLNGIKEVKVMDKGFVSINESKKNNIAAQSPGIYHVRIN